MSLDLLPTLMRIRKAAHAPDMRKPEVFVDNLVFIYQNMIAMDNLLAIGIEKTAEGSLLHSYYLKHLEEEADHATWMREDLLSLGVEPNKVRKHRYAVEVMGAQYYLLHHDNPACLLGCLAASECFPPSLSWVERLEELYGKQACRTIRVHAEGDVDHGAHLLEVYRELQPVDQRAAYESAVMTTQYAVAASATFGV